MFLTYSVSIWAGIVLRLSSKYSADFSSESIHYCVSQRPPMPFHRRTRYCLECPHFHCNHYLQSTSWYCPRKWPFSLRRYLWLLVCLLGLPLVVFFDADVLTSLYAMDGYPKIPLDIYDLEFSRPFTRGAFQRQTLQQGPGNQRVACWSGPFRMLPMQPGGPPAAGGIWPWTILHLQLNVWLPMSRLQN